VEKATELLAIAPDGIIPETFTSAYNNSWYQACDALEKEEWLRFSGCSGWYY
jgi:hypothetical protein